MCRRNKVFAIIMAFLTGWGIAASGADEVAEYLQRLGMEEFLAVHLEQRLETITRKEREPVVLQLAHLYAEMLAKVEDAEARERIEGKSRVLLGEVPDEHADELRLALLRGGYRKAERVAELHRLRLASEEAVEETKQALQELIPKLDSLRRRVEESREKERKRLDRAEGAKAARVSAKIASIDALHAQCAYLNGWALYYQSWLHDRSSNARPAEALFAELLGADRGAMRPEDVSVDLRSTEPFARTILGMALSKALTSSKATALGWIQLLAHPRTHEALRTTAPIWETVILLQFDDYRGAREVVKGVMDEGEEISLAWLRLLAVHAIEAGEKHSHAMGLASFSVAQLAAQGELREVLALATRYGEEKVLGEEGFAQQYIRGVLAYHEVEEEHGTDEPAEDPSMQSQFDEAGDLLEQALEEADAGEFLSALPACRQLIARCRYFSGAFEEASRLYEEASGELRGDEAVEALWMAIICLDLAVRGQAADEGQGDRLGAMIDTFLALYPTSEYAPRLILKKAVDGRRDDPGLVDELLSIPEKASIYVQARSKAAQMLFDQFRAASPDEKARAGARFLAVASPLLEFDEPQILSGRPSKLGDEEVAERRYVIRSRQILEVSLEKGVKRLGAARRVFENLEAFVAEGGGLDDHHSEIEYRRVQERLYSGDIPAASEIADGVWEWDKDDRWTRLAVRALFQFGHRDMRENGESDATVDLVVRHGTRVLREFDTQPEAIDQPGVQRMYAAVAEARTQLWRRTKREADARLALELYGALLQHQSSNGRFLRAAGELSEAVGDDEYALSCWRRLVSGSRAGTDRWYEARYRVLALLMEIDPVRAREVMKQHKVLQPDYGPDPWGARLQALDNRLGVKEEEAPSSAESEDHS